MNSLVSHQLKWLIKSSCNHFNKTFRSSVVNEDYFYLVLSLRFRQAVLLHTRNKTHAKACENGWAGPRTRRDEENTRLHPTVFPRVHLSRPIPSLHVFSARLGQHPAYLFERNRLQAVCDIYKIAKKIVILSKKQTENCIEIHLELKRFGSTSRKLG